MKRRNYVVMMVVGIVAMVLMPLVPCRAGWTYVGSYVPDDDPNGSGGDSYYGWEYTVDNIDTSADSSGASASADCSASTWVDITVDGSGSVSRDPYTSCGSLRESYYYNPDQVPGPLYVDWSMSASGTVQCEGDVYDLYLTSGSLDVDSEASGGSGRRRCR